MEFRKEKNIIIATDNGIVKGQYDWVDGIFYGVKGTPIKTIPVAFKSDTVYRNIINTHQWILEHGFLSAQVHELALHRWECLTSLGLYTDDIYLLTDEDYDFPALKKDLVQYLKDNCECRFSKDTYGQYMFTKNNPDYAQLTGEYKRCVDAIRRSTYYNLPLEWVVSAALRLQLEDAYYIQPCNGICDVLDKYYNACKRMGQEPIITKNFIVTIAHTLHIYETYQREHKAELLRKHNDIPELYYENDTYIMRPLLTKEEFHAEAEAQHNCVEWAYLEKVIDGSTHVVVIRRKDNPSKSLITCEISNQFRIRQYYGRCNTDPKRAEAQFRAELSRYLDRVRENKA